MGRISVAYFPRPRVAASLLVAASFMVSGCQGGGSKGDNSASPSPGKWSCAKIVSARTEDAVRRTAGIHDSVGIRFHGDPADVAGELIAKVDAGTPAEADHLEFCSIYRESGEVIPAVRVRFSVEEKVESLGKSPIVREFRMGKSARAGDRLGILYFECSSAKFALGAGGTVLVRGESRVSFEPSETGAAAQEDNLRIVYEYSRAFADLLGCKSNAGLPATFTMPPKA